MKKLLICASLALVLALAVASCGGNEDEGAATGTGTASTGTGTVATTTAPADNTTDAVVTTATPADTTVAPVETTVAPVETTVAPAETTVAPETGDVETGAVETTVAVEETTAPAETEDPNKYVYDLSSHPEATTWPEAAYSTPVLKNLNYGTSYNLGAIDLSQYSSVVITYGSDASAMLGTVGSFIALTSNGAVENEDSSDKADADILAQANLEDATGAWATANRTVTIDLTDVDYSGDVYIAVDMKDGNGIAIAGIEFIKNEN